MFISILKKSIFPVLLLVVSCGPRNTSEVIPLEVLGTRAHITIVNSPGNTAGLKEELQSFIQSKNRIFSRYLEDSELALLNRATKEMHVSRDLFKVIQTSLAISRVTPVFDITVLPLLKIWDFKLKLVPDKKNIAVALSQTGWRGLEVEEPSLIIKRKPRELDLGGIAKGYIIDAVKDFLLGKGINAGIVEIGGDLAVFGERGWRVGITDPRDKKPLFALSLKNTSLVTSGDYERFFEKDGVVYSHIIDPRSGRPAVVQAKSVSVLGGETMIADALATAFFILGPEESFQLLSSFPGYHVLFIMRNGDVLKSPGFPYELEKLK